VPNPYVLLSILLVWLASVVGAFEYRAHIDAGDVAAARADDALAASRALTAALDEAQAKITALADSDAAAAAKLQRDLDQLKGEYSHEIATHHADLVRATASCAVPAADVGLLVAATGAGPDPGASGPVPAAGPVDTTGRTVAVSDLVESCESARGAFDRNAGRLRACIGAYDACRAAQQPASSARLTGDGG
jgi:hypothetical protein